MFLKNEVDGKQAFTFLERGTWVGRNVALYRPEYAGEYKNTAVLDLWTCMIGVDSFRARCGKEIKCVIPGKVARTYVDYENELKTFCYNNVEKLNVGMVELVVGCGSAHCDGEHGKSSKTPCPAYGSVPDAGKWVLQGELTLDDESVPSLYFRSRRFAEYFVSKSFLGRAYDNVYVDGRDLRQAVKNVLQVVSDGGVTWTLSGFYKAGAMGMCN